MGGSGLNHLGRTKKEMKVDESGTLTLSPPLSSNEKEWAKNFIQRAKERGLC